MHRVVPKTVKLRNRHAFLGITKPPPPPFGQASPARRSISAFVSADAIPRQVELHFRQVGPSRTGDQRGLWHLPGPDCWNADKAPGWWSPATWPVIHPKLSHLLSPGCCTAAKASGWWFSAICSMPHPKLSHLLSPDCCHPAKASGWWFFCNLLNASPKAFPTFWAQIVVIQIKLQGGDLLEFAQGLTQSFPTFWAQIVGIQNKLQGGDFLQFSQGTHPQLSHLLSPDCCSADEAWGWWSAGIWPVIHPKPGHRWSQSFRHLNGPPVWSTCWGFPDRLQKCHHPTETRKTR